MAVRYRHQKPHRPIRPSELFVQPPAGFYRQAALYYSAGEMEIEHFCKILDFDEDRVRLVLGKGSVTITGDGLTIASLEKGRILLRGQFCKVEFSYE